ncbi:mannose-6-phosphate isomerase [Rhodocytophaga aerolata]|uniref:Phosphohexomutase n=1 Tax=Rhodocytophaga aerolata TaxID=455078 RepID=A0ABT8R455_9BACT|nr:type I phosphomannose isomerase catalytic subunit [Rhodocytophaga aerolata]MDO1446879.1 mannose-6-phosphate isomerase [Rhodocytophaga aerolata]
MATTNQTQVLYPLIFHPIFKERIWGGNKLKTVLNKECPFDQCGESWEISAVPGDVSVVKEGKLQGKALDELIRTYKGELVGEKVYNKFGETFPLLIKFLDAQEDLSIQLHPNDELAQKRHNSFGKTEMWYVMQADKGSSVRSGFNRKIDQQTYLEHLDTKKLDDILNIIPVQADDVIFLPAGRVHSIGKGLVIAEIQQTSDVTYRIYDFDRADNQGKKRQLHTEEALGAIDYEHYPEYKTSYKKVSNEITQLVSSAYFTTNRLQFTQPIQRNYQQTDSFVVYICLEGSFTIDYAQGSVSVKKGDSVLLPASLKAVTLRPDGESKLVETYVP